jgi:5-methylcytosine-specific restriction endonuclease McrA
VGKKIRFGAIRRNRRKEAENAQNIGGVILGLLVGIYFATSWLISFVSSLWQTSTGKFYIIFSVTILLFAFLQIFKKYKLKKEIELERIDQLNDAIRNVSIDTDREKYIIRNADYKRGNSVESEYRRSYEVHVIAIFKNLCAKCRVNSDVIELDHFFMPKNDGGNFMMRHRNGYLVNNAIPLCRGCNRRKSDKTIGEFFSNDELLFILTKNAELTRIINDNRTSKVS